MLIICGLNSGFASRCCAKDLMWVSSSVLRRQHFLTGTLGCYSDHIHFNHKTMQAMKAMSVYSLEADSENILRAITPTLDPSKHKGQAGELTTLWLCWFRIFTYILWWCMVDDSDCYLNWWVCVLSGKIAVIGGCREYTGAPYFAAISALKIVRAWLCIFVILCFF